MDGGNESWFDKWPGNSVINHNNENPRVKAIPKKRAIFNVCEFRFRIVGAPWVVS